MLLHDRHNLLFVGLTCRRRVMTRGWRAIVRECARDLADQRAVLAAAFALLSPTGRSTVHADSAFCSQERLSWRTSFGYAAVLGVRSTVRVADRPTGR